MASPASSNTTSEKPTHSNRACEACAVSKAKCVRSAEDVTAKCERCKRLQRSCVTSPIVPRKPRRPGRSHTAHIAEQLDSLVSLLATERNGNASVTPQVTNDTAQYFTTAGSRTDSSQGLQPGVPNYVEAPIPGGSSSDPVRQQSSSLMSEEHFPSRMWTSSADNQLRAFGSSMALYFPFILIPLDTTAEDLRTTKPFLYSAIMMVTSYHQVSRQSELRLEFMQHCTEQIFFQGKKSHELLQGIIVFAAWYHHYLLPSPQLTNMVQLGCAMAFDLDLHRSQDHIRGHRALVEDVKSFRDNGMVHMRTLEERRTFLGLYYLSRGLSSNFGKIEPLQRSPYVEECCIAIESQQEQPSDNFLLFLLRTQVHADMASLSFPHLAKDYWTLLGTDAITMLVNSFEKDFETFKQTLDWRQWGNAVVPVHLLDVTIHNTKIALRKESSVQSTHEVTDTLRTTMLMTCLQSTKQFFESWLLIPPSIYHHLPITTFAQVAHASAVLGMLNTVQCAGWDLSHVHQIASFMSTMEILAEKYEEAGRKTDDHKRSGFGAFSNEGFKMRRLRESYKTMEQAEQSNMQYETELLNLEAGGLDIFSDNFWFQF